MAGVDQIELQCASFSELVGDRADNARRPRSLGHAAPRAERHEIRVSDIAPGLAETEFSIVRLGSEDKAKQVYAGMRPLTAQDVADVVVWVATRPQHVNVSQVLVNPTDQGGLGKVHRR